ncbi:hypothetical protein [Dyella sp. ASV21]|uniref:hypothetical protein n=1 Tax=Dyella sp. ASV21 TaxID=2795114 RepID=UPI0018EAF554|nr:hypothetical protein [Dyella sp. ASV21]
MEYLLAWRMVIAKALLRDHQWTISELADRVGHASASALSRRVGRPAGKYARLRSSMRQARMMWVMKDMLSLAGTKGGGKRMRLVSKDYVANV